LKKPTNRSHPISVSIFVDNHIDIENMANHRALLRKETCNVRQPMYLCHPVIIFYISVSVSVDDHTHIHNYTMCIQGGEDPTNALICRSLSAEEPLITGLFYRK